MTRVIQAPLALAGAVILALGLSACSGAAGADESGEASGFAVNEDTLVFGVVPDSADAQTHYTPLMEYIEQETDKTVEYHESTDYAALIEATIAGKIDVASFSGFTYVTAVNNGANIAPISSIITEPGAEPGYYSQAIVPVDSDVDSLEDFAGLKVCFVDPSSTSGYLFPSYELLQAGVDPEKDVTPVFAGKHDVAVQKTGEGRECEAGFAEDFEVDRNDTVKVVAEVLVPGAPIVYSKNLPQDLQDQLVGLLSDVTVDEIVTAGIESADTEQFRTVFHAAKPVDDTYFDTIRDICDKTNATQCQG